MSLYGPGLVSCVVLFHLKFTALYLTRNSWEMCCLSSHTFFFLIGRYWITATTRISNCFNLTIPNVWIRCFIVGRKFPPSFRTKQSDSLIYLFFKSARRHHIPISSLNWVPSIFPVPLDTASVVSHVSQKLLLMLGDCEE